MVARGIRLMMVTLVLSVALSRPAIAEVIRLTCQGLDEGYVTAEERRWTQPIKIVIDTDRRILELFGDGDILYVSTVNTAQRAAQQGQEFEFIIQPTLIRVRDLAGSARSTEYFSGSIDRETGYANFGFRTPRIGLGRAGFNFRGPCRVIPATKF